MAQISLDIPRPYNGGEWRVSKQITGPRGGKSWQRIISQPATGGTYITDLDPGQYKVTYWSNGWPSSYEFTVNENETVHGLETEDWYDD